MKRLFLKVGLLFVMLTLAAFLLVKGAYGYLALTLPLVVFLMVHFYRYLKHAQKELDQFVESVHYRDFSRHFDVRHAPVELQPLRKGFNEINSTFKVISKERETQYQYLQKILELVDTGILSYETRSGEVVWMNESLKKMLQVPYLRTVQSLEKRDAGLFRTISGIRQGETLIGSAKSEKGDFKVLLSCTVFQTGEQHYKLIAFQDVNEALDETESRAWQKLLSVMTHEIMNSVAPISSLADTLKHRLKAAAREEAGGNASLEDLELGIETIRKRSEGLLRFAETYRNLNRITELHLTKIYVVDLFRNLQQLMQPTFEQKGIELEIILKSPDLTLEADFNLLEQLLINLLVNALDAVKDAENPKVILQAASGADRKTVLQVADNGPGMSQEIIEKIFIPFFSTKKTGSGIGLSLCKQIMMLHKGNIQVHSKLKEGTVFSLHF